MPEEETQPTPQPFEFKHLFRGDLTAERMIALGKDGFTLVTDQQALVTILNHSLFFGRVVPTPTPLTSDAPDAAPEILPDNVIPMFE
jgi:hypothetical protein